MKTPYHQLTNNDRADLLRDLQGQMKALLRTASEALEGTGLIADRAEAYWLGHMKALINGTNRYDISMETTIRELEEADNEKQNDE